MYCYVLLCCVFVSELWTASHSKHGQKQVQKADPAWICLRVVQKKAAEGLASVMLIYGGVGEARVNNAVGYRTE